MNWRKNQQNEHTPDILQIMRECAKELGCLFWVDLYSVACNDNLCGHQNRRVHVIFKLVSRDIVR